MLWSDARANGLVARSYVSLGDAQAGGQECPPHTSKAGSSTRSRLRSRIGRNDTGGRKADSYAYPRRWRDCGWLGMTRVGVRWRFRWGFVGEDKMHWSFAALRMTRW